MQTTALTKHGYEIISDVSQDYRGKSKNAHFWSIAYNSMIVRILIWKRYSAEAIGSILQLIVLTTVFYLFATAVGFRGYANFGTQEIFIFFMSGFLILVFDTVFLWSPVNATQRELYNGTLEYLYFTPMRKYPYFLGYLIGSVITSSLVGFIPIYLLLIFYAHLSIYNSFMIVVVITILMFCLLSFGIMISLTVILFKQVQALISLLSMAMQFFTGAFIPLISLPPYLQPIAFLFPHTWAYELIRYYAFNGKWHLMFPLAYNWLFIIIFTIVYTFIALILQKKVIAYSKGKGLHRL